MGRSYNLKKSPINKGYAAKPSPMKEPFMSTALGAAIIGGAASAAVGGGISAIVAAQNRKKAAAEKAQAAAQTTETGADKMAKAGSGAQGTKLV
jgi:hypothetical protein